MHSIKNGKQIDELSIRGLFFFAYQFLTSGLAKVNIHHILDFPQLLTVYNIHGI